MRDIPPAAALIVVVGNTEKYKPLTERVVYFAYRILVPFRSLLLLAKQSPRVCTCSTGRCLGRLSTGLLLLWYQLAD